MFATPDENPTGLKVMKRLVLIFTFLTSQICNAQNHPKVLIAILIDVSTSAKEVSNPSDKQLYQLYQVLQKKKVLGTLAIAAIGNTVDKNFVRVNLYAEEIIPAGIRIDIAAEIATSNKNKILQNKNNVLKWIAKFRRNSKEKQPDFSDVEEMFKKTEQLLSEPAYLNYQKILIFSSDLKNDLGKGQTKWTHSLNKIKNLTILGLGVYNPIQFNGNNNFFELQSFDGVNQNIDVIIK